MRFHRRTCIPSLQRRGSLAWPALAGAVLCLAALLLAATPAGAAPALQAGTPGDPGAQLFQAKCSGCHTIGQGKLVGPDLKDVGARRDQKWLKSFITDPGKLIDAKDTTATQLVSQFNGLRMPTLGLPAADVDALVAYLRAGTGTAAAAAPASQAAGNPDAGRLLFMGSTALAGGGPACMRCHTVQGTGGLGGGSLGPDLTHVAARYPGPGLGAALQNIAFPTMMGPFAARPLSPQEGADLVAFFGQVDQQQAPVANFAAGALTAATWRVLGIALAGAAGLFVVLAIFWPRQRRSVSERLRRNAARRA